MCLTYFIDYIVQCAAKQQFLDNFSTSDTIYAQKC